MFGRRGGSGIGRILAVVAGVFALLALLEKDLGGISPGRLLALAVLALAVALIA